MILAEQVFYVAGAAFAQAVKGAMVAAIIWLVGRYIGRKLRLNKAPSVIRWIGTIAFWAGTALGVVLLLIAVYLLIFTIWTLDNSVSARSAILYVFAAAFTYWTIGGAIRYMLVLDPAPATITD